MANIRYFHKEALDRLRKTSWDEGGYDVGDSSYSVNDAMEWGWKAYDLLRSAEDNIDSMSRILYKKHPEELEEIVGSIQEIYVRLQKFLRSEEEL